MLIYKCFVLFVENIQEANKQHRNVLCNFKIEKEISKVRTQDSWTRKSGLSGSWFPFGNLAADQSSCVCLSAYLCIFVSVIPISCNRYCHSPTQPKLNPTSVGLTTLLLCYPPTHHNKLLLTSAWRQADVSMTSRRPRMRGTRRPRRLPQLVGPVWEESCCWEQVFPQTDFMAQF